MSDVEALKLAVGDEVRVHYHLPGAATSFVEGVVSRVEVATLRGRVFVVDAITEVILDRVQPVKPGYQNYIFYERWDDFPGRIQMLPALEQEIGKEPASALSRGLEPEGLPETEPEPLDEPGQREEQRIELQPAREARDDPNHIPVEVEQQDGRRRGLLATLFGR